MNAVRVLWFWEERTITGQWSPVKSEHKPEIVTHTSGELRLKKTGGLGPRIRKMPQEIDAQWRNGDLTELQCVYGGE